MSLFKKKIYVFLYKFIFAVPRKLWHLKRNSCGSIEGIVICENTTWKVQVAMTRSDRYIGLGGRAQIPERNGMLFVYPFAAERLFSMRGCLTPLDLAFLSARQRVVSIHTMMVEPNHGENRPYLSGTPSKYVLEVPAGELVSSGVKVGSKVFFGSEVPPAFLADPADP